MKKYGGKFDYLSDDKTSLTVKNDDLSIVDLYFNELGNFSILSPEELEEKFRELKKYEKDSKEYNKIKNFIAERNLRLVPFVVRNYVNKGLEYMDLIGEGNIALLQAIELFDIDKGNQFSTYAITAIKNEIEKNIYAKSKTVRVPSTKQLEIGKLKDEEIKFMQKEGRFPNDSELATLLDTTEDKIELLKQLSKETVSLNNPNLNNPDTTYQELIRYEDDDTQEEVLEDEELKEILDELLKENLTEFEIDVITKRMGLNKERKIYTLKEIGSEWNYSREYIRKVQNRVIKKLRNPQIIQKLNDYLCGKETPREDSKPFIVHKSKQNDNVLTKKKEKKAV